MVDKEMLATSTAIEEAVLRMDEILNQAKKDTTGVKLEVNQSILGSCSDLMKAVHILVTASTDLQKDIVEGGRGAASVREFYAKNSRWTEGLISASKAVGWGATQLLDSADRVVGEQGTYEELIACSHEIAASTAQLVAASKVKADRSNRKLHTLQQASRHVNDMAAVVVTSTKHGQQQISDHGVMDFSGMSLIKLKKEEMEAQVKVLQLESQLEQERVRLGELRKRHYDIRGPENGPEPEDGAESFPPPPPAHSAGLHPDPPVLLPDAALRPHPEPRANQSLRAGFFAASVLHAHADIHNSPNLHPPPGLRPTSALHAASALHPRLLFPELQPFSGLFNAPALVTPIQPSSVQTGRSAPNIPTEHHRDEQNDPKEAKHLHQIRKPTEKRVQTRGNWNWNGRVLKLTEEEESDLIILALTSEIDV
ncbi:huntingtin-interacting protein 1-related protein-like [Menidia menidia]